MFSFGEATGSWAQTVAANAAKLTKQSKSRIAICISSDTIVLATQQRRDPLAGMEHADLHCSLRRADDLSGFGDRLFVIADEVDDLALRQRQLRQALPQNGALVLLLHDHLGTVRDCREFCMPSLHR